MTLYRTAAPLLAAFALTAVMPAAAQTTRETKVTHDTDVKNGVVTDKTKVVQVAERKTRQPKKVLGVKVGHKTAKTKVVKETTRSSNGDVSTKVKTSH